MCTVVVLNRPGHEWPLLLAGNRDEMSDRPWMPPGRHWPDRAEVAAGLDELGGGSWAGMNDHGVVAAILNRMHTLGPAPGKRTRGELVLEALDHADAVDAAEALAGLEPGAYRAFNMVIADNRDAYWLRNDGERMTVTELPPGLSMLTAADRNDTTHPRIRRHLPRFEAASAPDPAGGDWSAWTEILATRAAVEPGDAMTIVPIALPGFGTVSSCLMALPARPSPATPARYLFCNGRPGEAPYLPVEA